MCQIVDRNLNSCARSTQLVFSPRYIANLVDDMDIPPVTDESDHVNAREFWEKIEQMHVAKGVCGKSSSLSPGAGCSKVD